MFCPRCDDEVSTYSELDGMRIVHRCHKCQTTIDAPVTVAVTTVSQSQATKPLPAKAASKAIVTKAETPNVLKLAKRRLNEVRAQIKTLRKLEQEERELSRIIDAASKPLAQVRELRKSS